jgi:predicted PurR-regulated permease PerM
MDTPIILFVVASVLGLIGFFTRTAYSTIIKDIKQLSDDSHKHFGEQGKLRGKIELLEQEHRLKYQLIQETTQQEIKNMATKVGELSDMVGELVRVQLNVRP